MRKEILHTDKRIINGSTVTFQVFQDMDYEDLVLHKIQAAIHKRTSPGAPSNTLIYTYKTIRDYLVKETL
jgi:hypothetical protein